MQQSVSDPLRSRSMTLARRMARLATRAAWRPQCVTERDMGWSFSARAGSAWRPHRCGAALPRPARVVACWAARSGTGSARRYRGLIQPFCLDRGQLFRGDGTFFSFVAGDELLQSPSAKFPGQSLSHLSAEGAPGLLRFPLHGAQDTRVHGERYLLRTSPWGGEAEAACCTRDARCAMRELARA